MRRLLAGKRAFVIALSLAVVTFAAAAVLGALWWAEATGDEYEVAQTRDELIAAGTRSVRAFTEFDHAEPERFRDAQLAVATEKMRNQVVARWDDWHQLIVSKRMTADVTVLGIAVDELNTHDGEAVVLAAVKVHNTTGEQARTQRLRLRLELTRVGDDWKVAEIGPLAQTPAGT